MLYLKVRVAEPRVGVLRRATRSALILALPFGLSACALKPYDDDGIVKNAAALARMATPAPEPSDFVKQQRPAESLQYLPVGVTPPKRERDIRSASGAAALEAELDSERKAAQTFATRAAPPATYDGSKPPPVKPPPKELMPQ